MDCCCHCVTVALAGAACTCDRYETNLLNTAAQALDFIEEINHPNVYVHLDSYHMNIEEASMEIAVRLCGSKLG